MSRRYRVTTIALGLTLWTGLSVAQEVTPSEQGNAGNSPSVKEERGRQAQDEGQATKRFEFPVRIIEDTEEAARTERAAEDAAQRERDDLAAQQSMAKSTKRIVVISWWQLGLATGGTILVFGSLWAAFWSNMIARQALRITEDTAKRQLRAYVNVIRAKVRRVEAGQTPVARVQFMNSGDTPAYNLLISTYIQIRAVPTPEESFEFRPLAGEPSNTTLGAHCKTVSTIEYRELSAEDVVDVDSGVGALYVYGRLSYVDIFDELRETTFRLRLVSRTSKRGLNWCAEGNRST